MLRIESGSKQGASEPTTTTEKIRNPNFGITININISTTTSTTTSASTVTKSFAEKNKELMIAIYSGDISIIDNI